MQDFVKANKDSITRIVVVIFIWVVYSICYTAFYPVLTNHVALTQLNNSDSSYYNLSLYQQMWKYIPWVIGAVSIWIVYPIITKFVNFLKEQ